MEDYPGQNYYWKHSPNIKQAETKFYAAINGTERKMTRAEQVEFLEQSVTRLASLAADGSARAEIRLEAERQLAHTVQVLQAYGIYDFQNAKTPAPKEIR